MFKKMIPLLVLALVVASAPDALASHCLRCAPPQQKCVPALQVAGYATCEWDVQAGNCYLANPCTHGGFSEEPLGEEFLVASVERLDETLQPNPAETRVASLETAPAIR